MPLEAPKRLPPLANIKTNPPDLIAIQAAFLGVIFGVSLTLLFQVTFYPFPLYLLALSVFHFMEFWITAKYNPAKVSADSFLINHSGSYLMAHSAAITECLIELYLVPGWKTNHPYICLMGGVLMVGGQTLRSLAMKTAGESFSHIIVTTHDSHHHKLITDGVYQISRHPSYTGYFWWCIGSQLVLGNPVCFVGFSVVLWRFFSDRIAYEEDYLIRFFGDKYLQYKKTKTTWIPLIR
ncbi:protein-S-isoprenylcysteine carboxyl O-methyltransferase [Saccharomycopsis crataegensis]|uniref:Protein-S-isoprenylcysteine O-methyltransferase n=1 Tax=Saccharomycopsis crataegensis TaxID=43959 RepID=A0AAV5QUI4_9ASCO|nr:protein-S-isoprenylcysteine carboxyl O-methyltransferase [Saccharomycopsis crataegensis]